MRPLLKLVLAAVSVVSMGCAKQKMAPAPDLGAPAAVPGGRPPSTPPSSGSSTVDAATVPFKVIGHPNQSTMRLNLSKFFRNPPPNNPTNITLSVNLSPSGSGYGGEVRIGYDDNGGGNEAVLTTTHPMRAGVQDTSKNVWFNWGGKNVFHGFFQDRYGAIVLVVDETDDQGLGDGNPATTVSGSVWFQNFDDSSPWINPLQGPLEMCWNIRIGPYDCRTFIVGEWVQTTSSLYPNNYGGEKPNGGVPYEKLGTFEGLNRAASFGN